MPEPLDDRKTERSPPDEAPPTTPPPSIGEQAAGESEQASAKNALVESKGADFDQVLSQLLSDMSDESRIWLQTVYDALPTDKKFAKDFGVIEAADDGRIVGFHEKNPDAPTIPGRDDMIFASMGTQTPAWISTRLRGTSSRFTSRPRLLQFLICNGTGNS